jgi:hypothetical protein
MYNFILEIIPPIITFLGRALTKGGGSLITGTWVHLSFEDDSYTKENLCSIFKIRRLHDGFRMDGTTYYPNGAQKDTYTGDLCRLRGDVFEFFNSVLEDESEPIRVYGIYNFSRPNQRGIPNDFQGFYVSSGMRASKIKRPVFGMRISRSFKKRNNINTNMDLINKAVPEIKQKFGMLRLL